MCRAWILQMQTLKNTIYMYNKLFKAPPVAQARSAFDFLSVKLYYNTVKITVGECQCHKYSCQDGVNRKLSTLSCWCSGPPGRCYIYMYINYWFCHRFYYKVWVRVWGWGYILLPITVILTAIIVGDLDFFCFVFATVNIKLSPVVMVNTNNRKGDTFDLNHASVCYWESG